MGTRRTFLRASAATAAAALLNACGPATAPLARRPARVAYLGVNFPTDADNVRGVDDFRRGLLDYGLLDGRDIKIDWSWAEGRGHPWVRERTAALADERVDVIVVAGSLWKSVRELTTSIPIVTLGANGEFLVARGWATSLAEPGGNITGLTFVPNQAFRKRLEYFVRVAPNSRRLAVMANFELLSITTDEFTSTAQQFGFETLIQNVQHEAHVAPAFARALEWHADALNGDGLSATSILATPVAAHALQNRMPSVFPNRRFVEAGGRMFYGAVYQDDGYVHRRAAWYVARIIDGTAPGKLPMELPTGVRFVVNKGTLAVLGLTLPSELASQVTTWVE
jgi:putative ABC transport system substrate-binding protein